MFEHLLILALFGIIIFQQVYMTHSVNKLVNKLMSRDYYSYKQTEEPQEKGVKIKLDEELTEDLSIISDIAGI